MGSDSGSNKLTIDQDIDQMMRILIQFDKDPHIRPIIKARLDDLIAEKKNHTGRYVMEKIREMA